MRQFAATPTRFALGALALGACTPLDDPNDVFHAHGSSGGSGALSQSGGAPNGGAPNAGGGNAGALGSGGYGGSDAPGSGGMGGDGGSGSGEGGTTPTSVTDAGSTDAGCFDPLGWQGSGCNRCPPTEVVSLENACSKATCTPFDNRARLAKLSSGGVLPPLPSAGSGGAPGTGGGSSSGGAGSVAGTGGAAGKAGAGGGGGAGRVVCDSLSSKGQVIYVTGSTAAKPFLQLIAMQLAPQNTFIVYTSTGSCVGVDAIVNGTRMTTGPKPAPAASAIYWDSAANAGADCDLPAAGVTADLGISDVFAQSCGGFELTSLDAVGVRDAHGAIQTMTFVVPTNSRFSEISAQAAYFVFGFGVDGSVLDGAEGTPIWNDETELHVRSATSGTQTMLAAAIGVPSRQWLGIPHPNSDEVAKAVKMAGQSKETADKALGILGADFIDGQNLRAEIRVLAFQDTSQQCAVFPDSTATSHDKQNVRDGHYPIWSPMHLLYKVDGLGNPVNSSTRKTTLDIIGYLSGTKELPNGVKLIDVYAQSGLIPECAMHVARTKDGGNIVPFQPAAPCSCLFEAKATGTTGCTACRVQGDCATGQTCSQGYCER
jgi:hypothetical protein